MPRYEIREFQRELDVETGGTIVDAAISAQGCRESTPQASNYALIELPDGEDVEDDTEGVDALCGFGGCQRSVSDPDDRCWQHEDEE